MTIKPPSGGALLSALSEENAGVRNYTIKRNWRRYLDREIRSEGFARFCPKMFEGVIPMPASTDDITLSVMLRHPNGRTAIVVGTESTLWRYAGLEDPLYVDADYVDADYYTETATAWQEIGSGFSAGRRWEATQINGYLVLNNAVDLPMTYRLTDDHVIPIYELRELAVASVGTITAFNSVLFCSDIKQIKETQFDALMSTISIGSVGQSGLQAYEALAEINSGVDGVAGNVITASNGTFNSGSGFTGMEGLTIRMANGVERIIDVVTSSTVASVLGDAVLVTSCAFYAVPGDRSERRLTGVQVADLEALGITDPVGLKVWWASGESREINYVADPHILVNGDRNIPTGPASIENPAAYAKFDDAAAIDRIQWRNIRSLPEQPRRFGATYPGTVTPSSDIVTLDYPVKSIGLNGGYITITGMVSGNLTTNAVYFDGLRIFAGGYSVTGFYSNLTVLAADAQASELLAVVVVDQTSATLAAAEAALVEAQNALDADPGDATLSAAQATASAAVDAAQKAKTEADTALAAAIKASDEADAKLAASEVVEIQLSDAVSNISRQDDLEDDGSAILRALPLRTSLVIYKETSIFLCRQSGSSFVFSPPIRIPVGSALFYRNTLIDVGGGYHLYASENQFCRFDMTNQVPVAVPLMKTCQDVFFNAASPDVMEQVFAADNQITSEIYFAFPSDGEDRALVFEYEFGTMATSSIPLTAGATVTFPGRGETVFIMGGAAGSIFRYGLIAGPSRSMAGTASKAGAVVTASSGVFAVTDIGQTIRFANGLRFGITSFTSATQVTVVGSGSVTAQAFTIEPTCYHHDGVDYDSILQSGADAFGSESSYKKINRYNLMVSSFSPDTEIGLIFRSGGQANAMSDRITTTLIPPETLAVPLLEDYFLSDRLEVTGMNNPVELTSRIFSISGIRSDSFGRRVV